MMQFQTTARGRPRGQFWRFVALFGTRLLTSFRAVFARNPANFAHIEPPDSSLTLRMTSTAVQGGRVVGLTLLLIGSTALAASDEPQKGFKLPDVTGKTRSLAEFRGRPVVLNFWAFWCDTWKAEMPHLRQLAVDAEERNFSIIAISVDGTRLDEFKRREPKGVPFPVLLDCGKEVSERFGIAHVPTIVILDREGKERYRHIGYPGNHVVLREIRKIESEHLTGISRSGAV